MLTFREFMEIPTTTRNAQITYVKWHSPTSVIVSLSDGTTLRMTGDQFRYASKNGEPVPGKNATITFQRRPEDTSDQPSQVQSFIVH